VKSIQFVRELADPLITCGSLPKNARPEHMSNPPRHLLTTSATLPGAITPRARVRSDQCTTAACSTVTSEYMERVGCALSTLRYSPASGFFLVSAVYMIAEKAAETLLHDT